MILNHGSLIWVCHIRLRKILNLVVFNCIGSKELNYAMLLFFLFDPWMKSDLPDVNISFWMILSLFTSLVKICGFDEVKDEVFVLKSLSCWTFWALNIPVTVCYYSFCATHSQEGQSVISLTDNLEKTRFVNEKSKLTQN